MHVLACASAPAFSSAISTLLTRFGCPLPMPSRRPALATVIALLFTCFTRRQASARSSSCSGVARAADTGVKVTSSAASESASWYSHPPVPQGGEQMPDLRS